MYGKIEPSQAVYSFKDQVLISCDTGYKVLKVKNAAWEGERVGQKTSVSQVFPSILLHYLSLQDTTQKLFIRACVALNFSK